jgi:hypothetical protein
VHEILLKARILAAIDNSAVVLLSTMRLASSMGITILLLLHQLLIEHFLVPNFIVNLII